MDQNQLTITAFNKTALVEIFIWIPLSLSFLSVVARLATKLVILGRLQLEDHFISTALLASIGQSVAVAIQCANGFGQHFQKLSENEKLAISKAEYASGPFYIITLGLTKLSIVFFIIGLTPVTLYKRMSKIVGAVIILWAVSSVFASLFPCPLARPWDFFQEKCFDQVAFWSSVAIINIITDSCVILTVALIASKIMIPWRRKATIISIFGTRIFAIIATGFQLHQLRKTTLDPTFDPWPAVICTQVVQCLSIMTACIPYLKPFLASLESGLMRADDLRRRGVTSIDYYNHNTQNSNSSRRKKTADTKQSTRRDTPNEDQELSQVLATNSKIHPHTSRIAATSEEHGWDGGSQSSRSKIIQEIRTWNVDVHNADANEVTK